MPATTAAPGPAAEARVIAQRGAQAPVLALLGTRRSTGGLSLLILLALTIGTSVAPMLGDTTRGVGRGESEGTRISSRLLAQPIVRHEQRRVLRQREVPAQERAAATWPGSGERAETRGVVASATERAVVPPRVREALLALPPPAAGRSV